MMVVELLFFESHIHHELLDGLLRFIRVFRLSAPHTTDTVETTISYTDLLLFEYPTVLRENLTMLSSITTEFLNSKKSSTFLVLAAIRGVCRRVEVP